jgi:hypothetical protein
MAKFGESPNREVRLLFAYSENFIWGVAIVKRYRERKVYARQPYRESRWA